MDSRVDLFLSRATKWKEGMELLRQIVLDCGLSEDLKWHQPCYSFQNKIVLVISGFKDYCALNLFKGALLNDPHGILVKPGENTQAGRQIRLTSVEQITGMEPILKAYLHEAIEVEKAGLKVPYKKTADFEIPQEFQLKLDEIPALKTAFDSLTPGRQRAYLLHFSAPKQSKTREARVEKHLERILGGKGLDD